MMKIFYSAYTCQGNIGDLLITKYQIEEYAKYAEVFVDCHGMPQYFSKVIFDTNNPNVKDFEKIYGLYYRGKNIFKVLRVLNNGGFGFFCSSPGPRVPLNLPVRSLVLKMLGALIPYVVLNKRIKRYSLGVDLQFERTGFFYWINRWYFGLFDIIGLRSKENLSTYRGVLNNICYIPDMAFLFPYFDEKKYRCNHDKIALSFRNVTEYNVLIDKLKNILRYFNDKEIHVDLIYQVEEDKSFCERLMCDLAENNLSFKEKMVAYSDLEVYENYDMVISNRLHVLLIGAMNGAIPYGLISHDKKEKKIADVFSSVFSCKLFSYVENSSSAVIATLFCERDSVRSQIYKNVCVQRNYCERLIERLFN